MLTRILGRSGLEVSILGLGTWAIGGPFWRDGQPRGWVGADDAESIRAIHRALDLGITFFDTADVYGCGHSERLLGRALAGRRHEVIIATKFGRIFDEETRLITADDARPDAIRRACEASLRRLNTDVIDLYQLHIGDHDLALAAEVRNTLEELVMSGKIRYYGWSTDDQERARFFAEGAHCTAIQHRLNLFEGNERVLAVCETSNLASINRSPLGMGLLTGKFDPASTLPANDVRSGWDFKAGNRAEQLQKLETLREVLTRNGRTLAQAALGWLWARSHSTIPIPGFKSVRQVEENIGAVDFGPLDQDQMQEIDKLLARE